MTTPRHGFGSGSHGHIHLTTLPATSPTAVAAGRRRCLWCCRFCPRIPWSPRTRLFLFFIFYGLFLAPVLVALIREFYGFNADIKQEHLLLPIMHKGGAEFIIALSKWLGTLIVTYIVYRALGRRLGIKLHDKTLAKHKDDLLRLVYFGMTMAAVGGIAVRLEENVVNSETGLTFIPLTLAYAVFYTVIFELVKERDITLSYGLFENKVGMIVVLLGFSTCILVLVCLFMTAWQVSTSFFTMYAGVFAVGLLAHFVMFIPVFPGIPGRSYLHLHHWYWSAMMSHMCVFHTDVSMLAQAIFLAVHIHGVDCFGVEPLFYDTERRARHPSDFGKFRDNLVDISKLTVAIRLGSSRTST